jgi:hypothetical protein
MQANLGRSPWWLLWEWGSEWTFNAWYFDLVRQRFPRSHSTKESHIWVQRWHPAAAERCSNTSEAWCLISLSYGSPERRCSFEAVNPSKYMRMSLHSLHRTCSAACVTTAKVCLAESEASSGQSTLQALMTLWVGKGVLAQRCWRLCLPLCWCKPGSNERIPSIIGARPQGDAFPDRVGLIPKGQHKAFSRERSRPNLGLSSLGP